MFRNCGVESSAGIHIPNPDPPKPNIGVVIPNRTDPRPPPRSLSLRAGSRSRGREIKSKLGRVFSISTRRSVKA
jgi:hypothetical protein